MDTNDPTVTAESQRNLLIFGKIYFAVKSFGGKLRIAKKIAKFLAETFLLFFLKKHTKKMT